MSLCRVYGCTKNAEGTALMESVVIPACKEHMSKQYYNLDKR
jgi:hypothetical protein